MSFSNFGRSIGSAFGSGIGDLLGSRDQGSQIGSGIGSLLGGLGGLLSVGICRPMTDNSVIRTVGLGSRGGQSTQEYVLFTSIVGSRVLNAIHLHMDINALQVVQDGVLQYVQTGWLFAMILFDQKKDVAGKLSPLTFDEVQDEEEGKIYEGAGYIIWTRHGVVDGMMTRESINLMIKNQLDFKVLIREGSRLSLLASLYTNFQSPDQSNNLESAIMVGKVEFNIIGKQEDTNEIL
jgi:hypothetical protein